MDIGGEPSNRVFTQSPAQQGDGNVEPLPFVEEAERYLALPDLVLEQLRDRQKLNLAVCGNLFVTETPKSAARQCAARLNAATRDDDGLNSVEFVATGASWFNPFKRWVVTAVPVDQ